MVPVASLARLLTGELARCSVVDWDEGGVAQLGERLNGIQEVRGSIPLASMAWMIAA